MSAAWAMLHALVEGSTLERQILRHTIHTRTVGKVCKAQNLLSILEVRTAIQGIALSKSWEQSHTSSQGLMSGLDTCSGPGLVELNCATLTLGTHVSSQLLPNVLCAKCPNRFMASCRLAAAIRLAKITSSSCAVISDQIARKMAKHTTACRDQIKHRRITARRKRPRYETQSGGGLASSQLAPRAPWEGKKLKVVWRRGPFALAFGTPSVFGVAAGVPGLGLLSASCIFAAASSD